MSTNAVVNPFAAPACNISELKDRQTRLPTVYFPVHLKYICFQCILMKVLLHASAKKNEKALKVSNLAHFNYSFQMTSRQ